MTRKARDILALAATVIVGLILIASALTKFAAVPKVMAQLNAFGFDQHKVLLIAVAEVVGAVLFMMPRTQIIGVLIVSAFLGGAIATHLQHGESVIAPAVPLLLAWIGASLRMPQLVMGDRNAK